ncbi:MAG: transposase [Rhodospirillales bacterium]|nr:transposase [Rhodospirillales bacterium]
MLRERAVSVAPGTTEAAVAHLEVVFAQLGVIGQQLAKAHGELDRLSAMPSRPATSPEEEPGTHAQRDVEILSSLPGVGRIVLATLLAEAHDPLRRRDYQALRCLSGVAPVTKRSGKSLIVIRRLAAHNRLQDAVYYWAAVAAQRDPVSQAKYAALRARGHGHARPPQRGRPVARRRLRHAGKPDPVRPRAPDARERRMRARATRGAPDA